MMKVAPKEAYSPFKRHLSSAERSERSMRGSREEQIASSTDPRQVIAVLAELSGKNIEYMLKLDRLGVDKVKPKAWLNS